MSACCDAANGHRSPSWARRAREIIAWVLPSALFALAPKCPACLAAHVALWTGLGLSISAATFLRWALLLVCGASLAYLIAKRLGRNLATPRSADASGQIPRRTSE
jgi:hypothetical protein